MAPAISVRQVSKSYGSGTAAVHALSNVTLDVAPARVTGAPGSPEQSALAYQVTPTAGASVTAWSAVTLETLP